MQNNYKDVTTRFLRPEERLMLSEETEMPLVIEANGSTDLNFLHTFLALNSAAILDDISKYGAVLLRGFEVNSDEDFEKTILSIQGFKGISDAFMSEEGRTHVGDLHFVLHTNTVYKTGGTLYLGGFHSENYYSTDVPSHICFCCLTPSNVGGETGLVNMEKLYKSLSPELQQKLEKKPFFVGKWLVSEVAERYRISTETIEKICNKFDLPVIGEGAEKTILMYKPSVFLHPQTNKKALQINLFELPTLNAAMRKCFMADYQGKTWFWHRFVWRLPSFVFRFLERFYIVFASFFHSPTDSLNILKLKLNSGFKIRKLPRFNKTKVNSCFSEQEINDLARLIRNNYSSCLWKKGDLLLIDNRKVAHAGMPGAGPRVVRAMICNPIDMKYSTSQSGLLDCRDRSSEAVGFYMAEGD